MNAQNAHLYLPLVQALAEGKVIQHRTYDIWTDLPSPNFCDAPEYYRVKPYCSAEIAKGFATERAVRVAVEYVEVVK